MKTFFIILLIAGATLGSYFGFQHYYVEKLKLSEIVGSTEETLTDIDVNFLDYDTNLTRHYLCKIESSKEYWLKRMKNVESITDPHFKVKENQKLLAELMEDPTMKKILTVNFKITSSMAKYKILFHNSLLQSRYFRLFTINPNSIKNHQHVKELLNFGTMAA